jgi:hypothetical protein
LCLVHGHNVVIYQQNVNLFLDEPTRCRYRLVIEIEAPRRDRQGAGTMGKMKHFSGDTELTHVHGMPKAEFATRFPGTKGRPYDGFSCLVGSPVTEVPNFDRAAQKWIRTILPVERSIEYKSNPSKHKCDDRCVHARGRVMKCECSCGGKNHGKGAAVQPIVNR